MNVISDMTANKKVKLQTPNLTAFFRKYVEKTIMQVNSSQFSRRRDGAGPGASTASSAVFLVVGRHTFTANYADGGAALVSRVGFHDDGARERVWVWVWRIPYDDNAGTGG